MKVSKKKGIDKIISPEYTDSVDDIDEVMDFHQMAIMMNADMDIFADADGDGEFVIRRSTILMKVELNS